MRIRLAVPDELDDQDRKAALDAALEATTRAAAGMIRKGLVPSAARAIKAGRVKWHPEPPGDEHFDLPDTVLRRGHGDCDDLASWHAGGLIASGVDPHARAVVKKSGPKRWHAYVVRGDGSKEDPSVAAGMGQGVNGFGGVVGAYAPIAPPMSADGRLCMAICPSRDPRHPHVWFARIDVPDKMEPWEWSSSAAAQHPGKAVVHAVRGACRVAGEDMEPEDTARLKAVHDLIMGADPDEIADELEELLGDLIDVDGCMDDAVHSVGWFGEDLVKSAVAPLASAAKFVTHPSLSNFGSMLTAPVTAPLQAARGVMQIPGMGQLLQAGLPIAGTMFGGPLGTMAGGALAQMLAQGGGGGGGLPFGLASMLAPGGGGGQAAPGGGGLFSALASRFAPGVVARPWGGGGPAVMRF